VGFHNPNVLDDGLWAEDENNPQPLKKKTEVKKTKTNLK